MHTAHSVHRPSVRKYSSVNALCATGTIQSIQESIARLSRQGRVGSKPCRHHRRFTQDEGDGAMWHANGFDNTMHTQISSGLCAPVDRLGSTDQVQQCRGCDPPLVQPSHAAQTMQLYCVVITRPPQRRLNAAVVWLQIKPCRTADQLGRARS